MWIPITVGEQRILEAAKIDGQGHAPRALRRYLAYVESGALELDVVDVADIYQRARSRHPYGYVELFVLIAGACKRAGFIA